MKNQHVSASTHRHIILQTIAAIILLVSSALFAGSTMQCMDVLTPEGGFSLTLAFVFLFICSTVWISRIIGYQEYHEVNIGAVFSLLLTATGVLLLCFNTGFLPAAWKGFFFSWPMLLFVIGAIGICRFHYFGGFITMLTGVFFLIPKTANIYPGHLFGDQFVSTYWAALIILFGGITLSHILFRNKNITGHSHKRSHKCFHSHDHSQEQSYNGNYTSETKDGKINYRCVFGGIEQTIFEPEFKGGTLEAIFGGIVLDLRHTTLPEGETQLYVKAGCGGVEITVPADWDIKIIPAKSIFGGVQDSRVKTPVNSERKLIIVAECVFGGLQIK